MSLRPCNVVPSCRLRESRSPRKSESDSANAVGGHTPNRPQPFGLNACHAARDCAPAATPKTLRLRIAVQVSLQWDREHDQGRDCNGHTSGIAGSRGVRFSSSTEQDIDDWYSSDLLNGYGANPAVWDHAGFIGEFGLARDFSPGSSGNFAIFTAIRRASSLVSNFAADLRPGSSSK